MKKERAILARESPSELAEFIGEFIPEAIVVLDLRGLIISTTRCFETMFGFEQGELIGQSVDCFIPQLLANLKVFHLENQYFLNLGKARVRELVVEAFGLRKHGVSFPIEAKLATVETAAGVGNIVVVRDLSERRQHEGLLEPFGERRDNCAVALADDLTGPLFVNNRTMQHLLDGEFGPLSDTQSEVLKTLYDCNNAVCTLIGNFIEAEKYESGSVRRSLSSVDLTALVSSLLDELVPLAKANAINLERVVPDKPIFFDCDSSEIKRVIGHLVGNALSHTPGGGTVKVSLAYNQLEAKVRVVVADSGRGIPEVERPFLFQRFWPVPPSPARLFSARLGLFLCRKIVELNGGTILCESKEGVGTTFCFTLSPISIERSG